MLIVAILVSVILVQASLPARAIATPTSTASPTPAPTFIATAAPEKLPTPTAAPPASAEGFKTTLVADWEDMFQGYYSYEYVSTKGRPDDEAWWTEQTNRFFSGEALASQLQQIEQMFSPKPPPGGPGFVQDARYTVEVDSCSSETECTLKVAWQSGQFWVYDVHRKSWQRANPIAEPFDWTIPMQYDREAGRWKAR